MRVSRWFGALWLRGCLSCLFPLPFSFVSVAELVDAPDSKSGIRWGVWVRVPPEVLAWPATTRDGAYDASLMK